ncbi:MAG: MFS transporter [Syntrophobacteraceae bacterium]|nr:MFS transporter [Syntrophobacteraceae bacterium]
MTLQTTDRQRLFSIEFVMLNLIIFFSFCNMAVFYSFFDYLARISIPSDWRGFLVGLEPMSAFLLRLAAAPLLHAKNAAAAMIAALILIMGVLCSYGWVVTVPGLIVLRVIHGAAFVLLVSAAMALVVHFIPKDKSGQGFGIISVSVLVPYAIMPLITESLKGYTQNEAQIYRGVTILAIPALLLLLLLRKRLNNALSEVEGVLVKRPKIDEIRTNLKDPRICLLLLVNLFVYLSYATVFYFMKGYAAANSITEVGWFFTIATIVMIALRLGGGLFFDKIDKTRILQVFMLLLAPCFMLFGHMNGNFMFFLMAGYYGLCIGFIMPLLNATLFEVSAPQLRGVNINLALFAMDAGFFISPYLGGVLIASGRSVAFLFNLCAGIIFVNLVVLVLFEGLKSSVPNESVAR